MKTLHDFQRLLGETQIKVSPLGLGTVKLGRDQGVKYPEHFSIPSDQEVSKLLKTAYDMGINTLDTAPAYGNSEQRLGQLLHNRHDWIIVSKAGEEFVDGNSFFNFTPEHISFSIKRSLQRLKTDYIDVLLIHSDGNDLAITANLALWECLADLKKQGFIRAYGLSGKTVAGGVEALKLSDCAMVTYNLNEQSEKSVLNYALENNKGVFVKKALASGHVCVGDNKSLLQASFELIFTHPAVTSVIIGTINLEHLQQNVQVAVNCLSK